MKRFLQKWWPILLIALFSGLILWPLFLRGYFSLHDNIQVIRIFEMRKCFTDLQIPCRWVPDMGYGNGYPLFNFYGPLPYYIAALASYVFGFIGSAKFIIFLPLFFGAIGMYLLARELFGVTAGATGAILFLFAPYRAVDAYVRGAIGESFAIALIPFVFFFTLKLIKEGRTKFFALSSFFLAAFFISHNIMTLIFTPFIILWIMFWLWEEKRKNFKITILSFILAFGMSAFFILPAFFEKNLVQTDTLTRDYYDFRNHFAAVFQLFTSRFWGYGGSVPGINDQLSFQIGWPHWWLAIGALIIAIARKDKSRKLILGLIAAFLFSIFMTHNKSSFIWENIKVLSYVQFPWRFLGLSIFFASLLGAYFVGSFKNKTLYLLALGVIGLTTALNWQYFRPGMFNSDDTDVRELSGALWVNQQAGAILDYLPKTAVEPKELAPKIPYLVNGKGILSDFENKSDEWSFNAKISEDASVDVPVFDFPNWIVNVDGREVKHFIGSIGRINLKLPGGNYRVEGRFSNTPVRTVSNMLSLASFAATLGIIFYAKNRKIFI